MSRPRETALLFILTALAAALSWWPLHRLPWSFWLPLACVVLCTGAASALRPNRWVSLLFTAAASAGAGSFIGSLIWPPDDPIAGSFIPYGAATTALIVFLAALPAGLILRLPSLSGRLPRKMLWTTVALCVAFGPVFLLLEPPINRERIARNERMAELRFTALKHAMESATQAYGTYNIFDARALKPHYHGPPFAPSDWQRMAGNAVFRGGYSYMLYHRESRGYTLSVRPQKEGVYGNRSFCTDETRQTGCRVDWNGHRNQCHPCPLHPTPSKDNHNRR